MDGETFPVCARVVEVEDDCIMHALLVMYLCVCVLHVALDFVCKLYDSINLVQKKKKLCCIYNVRILEQKLHLLY